MPEYKAPNHDWFVKHNLPPPTVDVHGGADDIRANLKSANPRNWRMEGNQLIADTDFGPLVQTVPTTHILTGTDKNGLPVFKEI